MPAQSSMIQKELFEQIKKVIPEQKFDKRITDKYICELAGVFCDPLVMPNSGWSDTLPPWVRDHITIQRLFHIMKCLRNPDQELEIATDIEAMAYIYPLAMDTPLDHNWTQIYLYTATVGCRFKGINIPDDVETEWNDLNDYQKSELNRLKRWIYQKRKGARPKKTKAKNESKIEVITSNEIQIGLFQ